jgi:uncharacterized membrane protein
MVLLFLGDVVLKSLGPFKIPMLLISLIVILMIAYSVFLKFQKKGPDDKVFRESLNALLVVGSFNLALGMVGQIIGIWAMIDAIMEAGDINLEIVFTGIKISFGTTIIGLATFILAVLVWLPLRYFPVPKRA